MLLKNTTLTNIDKNLIFAKRMSTYYTQRGLFVRILKDNNLLSLVVFAGPKWKNGVFHGNKRQ